MHLVTVDEAWAGSSPLTRGKLVLVDQVPQVLGIIPAHAGKTLIFQIATLCR